MPDINPRHVTDIRVQRTADGRPGTLAFSLRIGGRDWVTVPIRADRAHDIATDLIAAISRAPLPQTRDLERLQPQVRTVVNARLRYGETADDEASSVLLLEIGTFVLRVRVSQESLRQAAHGSLSILVMHDEDNEAQ